MSEDRVLRDLSRLPYMSMRRLASRFAKVLDVDEKHSDKIAVALAKAIEEDPICTAVDIMDRDVFAEYFTRTRNIRVVPYDGGWRIESASAPTVHCNDIREGVSDFLDALSALRALKP